MMSIELPARQVPVVHEADVLVIGGGLAGVVASVAAARQGARVALVERYGVLGGMATPALVGPIAGVRTRNGEYRAIGGVAWEVILRLYRHGGALLEPGYGDVPCDPETVKWVADSMASEAGVELFLHTLAVDVVRERRALAAVVVENKAGRQALVAKVFVDASGDADIAARAGVPFDCGRLGDGALQPMSLAFRLGGVDTTRLGDIGRPYIDANIRLLAEAHVGAGRLPVFGGPWTFKGSTFRPGEVFVNMVRLWGDATDPAVLARNEVTGRAHLQRFIAFLKENVPAFANCYLIDSGTQIGVRETRRIRGEYQLTADDIRAGRRFADSIALGEHSIDIHSPTGNNAQVLERLRPYQIPYGCLLPLEVDNLLVAGRPISATHEAHASLRVMGTCMATGEAAGTAATLAAQGDGNPRHVDVPWLRQTLATQGALLDEPSADWLPSAG
ncbi:MAG: FAD-dependent oxidoreductase [Chloroflexota bacterium]